MPFLKQRQLLPEEKILGCKCVARAYPSNHKTSEIEKHDHRCKETLSESGAQPAERP
jgi:hypothetical protein